MLEVEVEARQQQAFEAGKAKQQACQQPDSGRDKHPADSLTLLELTEHEFVDPVWPKESKQRDADVLECCRLALAPGIRETTCFR